MQRFENSEGRLRDGEVDSDRPGRSFSSASVRRHGFAPSTPSHETIAEDFSRILAEALEQGRTKNAYDNLIVVAGSRFLGRLRQNMSSSTCAMIFRTVNLNLGTLTDDGVAKRLRSILRRD